MLMPEPAGDGLVEVLLWEPATRALEEEPSSQVRRVGVGALFRMMADRYG